MCCRGLLGWWGPGFTAGSRTRGGSALGISKSFSRRLLSDPSSLYEPINYISEAVAAFPSVCEWNTRYPHLCQFFIVWEKGTCSRTISSETNAWNLKNTVVSPGDRSLSLLQSCGAASTKPKFCIRDVLWPWLQKSPLAMRERLAIYLIIITEYLFCAWYFAKGISS